MKEIINPVLIPVINEGLISLDRINNLIYLKEFVDRISSRDFADNETINGLKTRCGAEPDIITWGDYFQTELASRLLYASDAEFNKAVDTVRFDMISAWMIFSNKDESFFKWVEESTLFSMGVPEDELGNDEMEMLHLKMLKDYYVNCGIENAFTVAEMKWYEPFKQAMAI